MALCYVYLIKPLHGEIKLPGQANHFMKVAVSEHCKIGIHAIELLKDEEDKLHSRGIQEPLMSRHLDKPYLKLIR